MTTWDFKHVWIDVGTWGRMTHPSCWYRYRQTTQKGGGNENKGQISFTPRAGKRTSCTSTSGVRCCLMKVYLSHRAVTSHVVWQVRQCAGVHWQCLTSWVTLPVTRTVFSVLGPGTLRGSSKAGLPVQAVPPGLQVHELHNKQLSNHPDHMFTVQFVHWTDTKVLSWHRLKLEWWFARIQGKVGCYFCCKSRWFRI